MKQFWPLLLLPIIVVASSFLILNAPQAQNETIAPEDKPVLTVYADLLGTFEITDVPYGVTLSTLAMDRSKFVGDKRSKVNLPERIADGEYEMISVDSFHTAGPDNEYLFIHYVLINSTKDAQPFDKLSIRLLDDSGLEHKIRLGGMYTTYNAKYFWEEIPPGQTIVGTLEAGIPAELTKEHLKLVFNDPITGEKVVSLSNVKQYTNSNDEVFYPWISVDNISWSWSSR